MLFNPNSSELFTCTGRGVAPVIRPPQQDALSDLTQSNLGRVHAAIQCRRGRVREQALLRLGLPNLGNSCYMNVILQSLLSLEPFMREVQNQASFNPMIFDQTFISPFIMVAKSRLYGDSAEKLSAVSRFKNSMATLSSYFLDGHQKSAQRCLRTILNNWEGFSSNMKTAASRLGMNYRCPVGTNIVFEVLRTISCEGCGRQLKVTVAIHELYLGLQGAHSVGQALGNVLDERALEERCRRCGSHMTNRVSFNILPNVLILNLCRTQRTAAEGVRKIHKPVHLCEELQLAAPHGELARYKLVSIISHLGPVYSEGHFICDSVLKDGTSRWLSFSDDRVEVEDAASLLHARQTTALILFYVKNKDDSTESMYRC